MDRAFHVANLVFRRLGCCFGLESFILVSACCWLWWTGIGVMFDKLTLLPWLLLLVPWQLYRGLFPMIGLICICLFLPPLHPRKVLAVAQIPREQILCHTLDASLVVVGLLKVLPIFISIVLEYCRVAIMLSNHSWSTWVIKAELIRNWLSQLGANYKKSCSAKHRTSINAG